MSSAAALLEEYRQLRDEGAPRYERALAYERYHAQACKEGRSPDRLRKHSLVESERFWARTVPGPDGHVYWTGGANFQRNDGTSTRPRRWVWQREHGPIHATTDVWTTCGESNCVVLEHLASGRVRRNRVYDRDRALGRMRVISLALGHSVSEVEWQARGERPGPFAFKNLVGVGTWSGVLKAAGLAPLARPMATAEDCKRALRRLADHLHRPPRPQDVRDNRQLLRDWDLPASPETIRRRLASDWWDALHKAGLVARGRR